MRNRILTVGIALTLAGTLAAQDSPPLRLSLRRALELATSPEGSTRIQLSSELVKQAQAKSALARGALLPSLDAQVTEQNLNRSLAAFGLSSALPIPGLHFPSVVGPFNVFDARATASQSVFDFSSIRRYQSSKIAVGAARAETDRTREQVEAQVAKAYLAAVKADADRTAVRANIVLAEAVLKQAENLKAAGTGTGIEVTRARVQLTSEKQRMLVAVNQWRRAQLELLRAMNMRLDTPLELTDALAFVPVDDATLQQAKDLALKQRNDLVAQQRREETARLSASASKMERLPSVAAFADYGSIGSGIQNAMPTRTLGISLRVPVFDGGRREARRADAESQLRQERLRTADLRDQIGLDVRLALDGLESAAEEVKVSEEGLSLSENELAQAQRRYEAGVGTGLEVTDAQTRVARARDNRIAALFHHAQARIDLGQAAGTLQAMLP